MGLDPDNGDRIAAAIDELARVGPTWEGRLWIP